MILIIALLVSLVCVGPSLAATYYVDFTGGNDASAGTSTGTAWKHVKGMTGASGTALGHTPVDGDIFVFKGGVTWDLTIVPWAITGGTAAMVTYTTDHSWFSGGAWSQPVFDQEGTGTNYANTDNTGPLLQPASGVAYVTLNDLKFYRCGPMSGIPRNAACVWWKNAHDITVTYNTFNSGTWFAMYFYADNGSTTTNKNYLVNHNDFSTTTSAIWIATNAANTAITDVQENYNTLHDGSAKLGCLTSLGMDCTVSGGGLHGDGLIHAYNVPNSSNTQWVGNVQVCSNRIYGDFTRGIGSDHDEDMTAFVFTEGAMKSWLVCNNDISLQPASNAVGGAGVFGQAMLFRQAGSTSSTSVEIYNNTFGFDSTVNAGGAVLSTDTGWPANFISKNNVISFQQACTYTQGGAVPTGLSDYNEYRCANQGFPGGWITDGGHSIFGSGGAGAPNSNPLFTTDFTNLHLTASSPGKGTGVDLTSLGYTILNSDRDGNARPSGSSWDMGAYQFVSSTTSGISGVVHLHGQGHLH